VVDLSIAEGKLTLHVRGADKLWAFKSSLEIPLVHIAGVRADPEAARGWYHGIRIPGTNVPGIITAGTFYQDGKRVSGTCTTRRRLSSLTCMTSGTTNWSWKWLTQSQRSGSSRMHCEKTDLITRPSLPTVPYDMTISFPASVE
jgi:hypothetical protein